MILALLNIKIKIFALINFNAQELNFLQILY